MRIHPIDLRNKRFLRCATTAVTITAVNAPHDCECSAAAQFSLSCLTVSMGRQQPRLAPGCSVAYL